ncbi:NFACT family protein [bacterium]|nr:NFACT family protein [bacterium]
MKSFCSFLLKNFYDENLDFLTNAKIQKIQQPSRKELIIHLRNHHKTKKFYVNISPNFFHVCFASDENLRKREIEIPKVPPMFCMLLRKYLENAKIVRAEIPDYERILELYFENYNEIGEKIEICLAIELMGRHSNIILYNVDGSKNRSAGEILGCMHNVGEEKSQIRELAGGLPYVYPPQKIKKDFLKTTKEEFEKEKKTAQNTFYYLTYPILEDSDYDFDKLNKMFCEPKIFINNDDFSF